MSLAPPLYGGSVFNEDGLDIDFRVESDNNTHALFVDAGSDAVTINTSTVRSSANLTIASTTLRPGVVIGKGYSYGQPNYHINTRDDIAGTTYPSTYYAQIEGAGIISNGGYYFGGALRQLDSAATAMIELQFINGGLQLRRDTGATAGSQLAISNPDVVFDTNGYAFNEAGIANYDFRVESDAQTHMLFVDAGNNCVNINETSNLGGKLNVNGAIITDSNHRVHIALPYFNFGAGGIADEYWVLARRYVGSAIQASGLMGRIIGSRGSTTSGNIASYQNIICQSAYLSNEVPGLDNQGLTANFEAIDIISISGVEYYAARARTSGGPCDNGLYFEGFMVNNTGDTNVFTATRASTAGVSVITTNVATLNSWVFRDTYLQAQRAGYDRITISGTETNFNDPGLDYDFRVESDTNTHALFVDAGNAAVRLADQVVFSATDAIGDPVGVVWAKPIGVNYTSNNGPTSYTIRLSCASIGEYFAIIRVVGLDPYADTGYYRYEAQVVGYLSSGIGTVISTNETPNQSVSFSTPTFAANQVNIPVTASGTNYRFQVTAEIYPRGAAATTRAFALSIV
jgi:hypothetical protein